MGIVRTQAHTTRLATPQRTADSRRAAPTPTIDPVIVWVVETGMPAADVKNRVAAAAVSAKDWPLVRVLVMRAAELDPEGYKAGKYTAAERALAAMASNQNPVDARTTANAAANTAEVTETPADNAVPVTTAPAPQ